MSVFIKQIKFQADHNQMIADLETVLALHPWANSNQIALRHRTGAEDEWLDAVGSFYDYDNNVYLAQEAEFSNWNQGIPEYTKNQIIALAEQQRFDVGRVRYMRLPPKTGLTVHTDSNVRFHYVLTTNPFSYVCVSKNTGMAFCQHVPANGIFYKVDTRLEHFVYNGGMTERIHLVICAA
jgi:hypothetical protein